MRPSTDYGSSHGRDPSIYFNRGQHASNGGTINNYGPQSSYYYQHQNHDPLVELYRHCSPSAAFNSKERFDPPRCTPATRCAIIQRLEEWIDNDNGNAFPSRLFWLYGGAGVGKSSLAQTIAEKHQGKLAASFFFSRNDPSRSNGDHLIPSLVSDLVKSFSRMGDFVREKILTSPDLFDKTYEVQILELLIEPLQRLSIGDFDPSKSNDGLGSHPRVIVIDGLDECQKTNIQRELVRVIARAIPHIPYPLRIFVTSRPESHLTDLFRHSGDLKVLSVSRYNLSEDPYADVDIRKFLEAEFLQICQDHRLRDSLPPHWPHPKVVDSIVERSSGHFIYASTVIKYIQPHNQMPHERLQGIIGLSADAEDQPYDQLDKLYWFIFNGLKSNKRTDVHTVLGILYLKSQESGLFEQEWSLGSNYNIIEDLLKWKRHHLLVLFDPLLSLVSVDKDLRILHKSLFDYLVDATRSADQHLNLAPAHEAAASYVVMTQLLGKDFIPTQTSFKNFAYHAQFVTKAKDPVKRYLTQYSQDVLSHHKFLHANIKQHPDNFFVSSLAYFLRTLSYQDSNSARQCLQRYCQNLRQTFRPKGRIKCDQQLNPGCSDMEDEIDLLLRNWCPIGFVPMKVDLPDDHIPSLITQEQAIFSAYAQASLYPDETLVSSLICGRYFIHAYYYPLDYTSSHKPYSEPGFVMLFTYSKHNNAISCSTFGRQNECTKAVLVRKHLNRAGKEFGYPEPPESGRNLNFAPICPLISKLRRKLAVVNVTM